MQKGMKGFLSYPFSLGSFSMKNIQMSTKTTPYSGQFAVYLLLLAFAFCAFAPVYAQNRTRVGAEVLVTHQFMELRGKRVGLITNHTAMVGNKHLIDVLFNAPNVQLTTLFGPEHGIRGSEDAGAKITGGLDSKTGLPIYSLYGETRKPTADMLKNVDVLVFDIQDVGARFYTYISTMGLAMQAAAENGKQFMVLDRPNPLGGTMMSGFVLEPRFTSFVGQYPIPVVHGLTVGELAKMIKGEGWLPGLGRLDLKVIMMEGWRRNMIWDDTKLPWIKPSPNIPDPETALVYAGTCFFEGTNISEGRGTMSPFKTIGAPWGNAQKFSNDIKEWQILSLKTSPTTFTPRSIEGMSAAPKLKDRPLQGIKITVDDMHFYEPVSSGILMLYTFYKNAPTNVKSTFLNRDRLGKLAGTDQLYQMLINGTHPQRIIESWQDDVTRFRGIREPYLLYP
jgi:uncharacterized protein YbbC (DUF1343 family)